MVRSTAESHYEARRAIVAALVSAKAKDVEARLGAAREALMAHGVEVVASVVQRRGVSRSKSPGGAKRFEAPMSSATFIGPGKADELARVASERAATLIVFLNDLSLAQRERLAELTGCVVVSCPDPAQLRIP